MIEYNPESLGRLKDRFKEGAISDWNGTRIWHQACDYSMKPPTTIH